MSWRKHESHREETKAVKQALKDAGINASVGHGTGTAWSWLEISVDGGVDRELRERVISIALEVTDRHGDYNGNISVD